MTDEKLRVGQIIRADNSWELVEGGNTLRQVFQRHVDEVGFVASLRGSHDFIVVDARMQGGGRAHNDIIPDEHYVTIRQLKRNGDYNEKGKTYSFYQCAGGFTCSIKDVNVVGEMKQTFVPL